MQENPGHQPGKLSQHKENQLTCMKPARFISAILILILPFLSCKKDKKETPPALTGCWTGKLGSVDDYPNTFYAVLFNKNGTIRVYSNADTSLQSSKVDGTYTLSGTTVKTTYSTISFNFSATAEVMPNFGFMEGSFVTVPASTVKGRFFLHK